MKISQKINENPCISMENQGTNPMKTDEKPMKIIERQSKLMKIN